MRTTERTFRTTRFGDYLGLDGGELLSRLAAKTGADHSLVEGSDSLGVFVGNLEQDLADAIDNAIEDYGDGVIRHEKLRELNRAHKAEESTEILNEALLKQLREGSDEPTVIFPADLDPDEEVFIHFASAKKLGDPPDKRVDEGQALEIARHFASEHPDYFLRHVTLRVRQDGRDLHLGNILDYIQTSWRDDSTGKEYFRFDGAWYEVNADRAKAERDRLKGMADETQKWPKRLRELPAFSKPDHFKDGKLQEEAYNLALQDSHSLGVFLDHEDFRFVEGGSRFEFADVCLTDGSVVVWLHNKRDCGANQGAIVSEQVKAAAHCAKTAELRARLQTLYSEKAPKAPKIETNGTQHFGVGLIVSRAKMNVDALGIRIVMSLNDALCEAQRAGFIPVVVFIENKTNNYGQAKAA